MEDIPIIDSEDENFDKKLDFLLHSTSGSSDYSNSRDREYNGQAHTNHGIRGKAEVKGLTMRDISDCIIMGFLDASGKKELADKTVERDKEFIGTEHENKNTWRYEDVYKLDCDFDPQAVIQNTLCHIEHMMGIFPNLPKNIVKAKDILDGEINF